MKQSVIELSVTAEYVSWTIPDAIRDLMQNGIDADKAGFPLTVKYEPVSGELSIQNDGAVLPRSALLLGFSSKREDASQVGQFGEGLKLACLSLVKLKKRVSIESGSETWVPEIAPSEAFDGVETLRFRIVERIRSSKSVKLVVEGVSAEDWATVRSRVIMLSDTPVNVPYELGKLKVMPALATKIFVGGIQITEMEKLRHGYDFEPKSIKIDRDRGLVNQEEVLTEIARGWLRESKKSEEVRDEFVLMLEQGAPDLVNVPVWAWETPKETVDLVVKRFRQAYGDAIPYSIREESEAATLSRIGMTICRVPEAQCAVLRRVYPSLSASITKARQRPKKIYSIMELTVEERANLGVARELVLDQIHLRDPKSLVGMKIEVVEFDDPSIEGMHCHDSGLRFIRLARRSLSSMSRAVSVMAHEVAHRRGDHHHPDFLSDLETTWETIFAALTLQPTAERTYPMALVEEAAAGFDAARMAPSADEFPPF